MKELLPHCRTERQRQIVDAVIVTGSNRKAAARLGLHPSAVDRTVLRVSKYAETDRRATKPPPRGALNILVVPDTQVKPGVPLDHLRAAGRFAAEARPDLIYCLGDWADMESLSQYDRGKLRFEGRRYKDDIASAQEAMEVFCEPIAKASGYSPEKRILYGNHEGRILRTVDENPILDGTISLDDLRYADYGWTVIPYLETDEVAGILFSHYFYNPNTGRAYGGTAHTKLKSIGLSFCMGHQQGLDIATRELPNGRRQFGIVAGSFYMHKEVYRGPQANGHWHGCLLLNNAANGEFDLSLLSLDYLLRKFG